MTEMVTGSTQGQDTVVSQPVNTSQPVSQSPATSDERLFRQSEVTDIVKREKQEAIDRYRRLSVEQPQYVQQKYGDPAQQAPTHSNTYNPDDIRRMAAEEAQRLMDSRQEELQRNAYEQDAQRIATEFFSKLETGKKDIQDFDAVMGDMDFSMIGNTVSLVRGFDNVSSIMYHLRKNPTQMIALEALAANPKSQKLAYEALSDLSKSIKANESAAKIKFPNEPLSQMRPANAGTDSGTLTIRDMKAKYKG